MTLNLTALAEARARMTFATLEHNAMPVLLEVALTALAVKAADSAWHDCPDDERTSACSDAYKAFDAALAKVTR